MRTSRITAPLVLACVAAACSLYYAKESVRFDQVVRPAILPDSVRVLGQTPTQPHKVVALVSVTTDFGAAGGYARLTWRLAEQAAQMGGQALLLGPESVTQTEKTQTLTGKVLVFDGAVPTDAGYAVRQSMGSTNRAAVALLVLLTLPALAMLH